ncbi:nucleotidyltransferase domain-containing protein [Filomicrobium sp.]|uniref:nucleotidyltransferase family protein n=1 Tax=Filomicrobium sp. TaxID=2024831 RepID=UPI00258B22D5|nr:nucleotidyltransferase domain-containing protein [Filomicrobium sp.]MCV0368513.1 nucleotidyltransferase domain-containing protein [Filomicrobium sp.]
MEPILKAEGASALYLFGSTARNTARHDSDVDILLETPPRKRISLLAIARLTRLASEAIHARVDLIPKQAIKPHIMKRIEPTLKKVF